MIALHLHNNIIYFFLYAQKLKIFGILKIFDFYDIIIHRLRLLIKSINYLLLIVVTPKNYVGPIFLYPI
jgi:hypothetical protein